MAVTNADILGWLNANPNADDALIVKTMQEAGVSPAQMASATGLSEGEVASRIAATVPLGQTITLGDTIIQPVYQTTGSGMDQQIGGIENVITYKATDNRAGGAYTQYTPTGEVEKTGTQQEVKSGLKEFALGAGLLFGLPTLLNAGAATGAAATLGTTAITAAEAAGLGLTAAEAASLGLSASEFAAATAGTGMFSGGIGKGLEFAGSGGAFDLANAGIIGGAEAFTAAELAALAAGTYPAIGAGAATILPPVGLPPTGLPPTGLPPTGLPPTGLSPTGIPPSLINAGVSTAVNSLLGGGTTGLNFGNLLSGGLGTAGSLLQMQESREAAQRAQARIDAETAAAKASAAFRPIGMTTRFGTSQFQVDPVTGQLTSAGYTLSPEAKAQQDRFMALSQQGLTQAEQAQGQFAPLQTGAQRLFGLGNQYLAQSPEAVAQNYLNQQMALLQPGRELELANLQNRLQQQGRGGLSVAQGGTLGATTPELQALYNARAQQEAQLAAQAQQAGQQQVLYGAGLLGQGTTAMGNYYAGQQAAYAPYTTAMGQVQGLEALGQQPLTTGMNLGQISAQAGANVGQLGLKGAGLSTALATSADATRNLGAQSLIAAGNPNAMFGQALGSAFGGLFGSTNEQLAIDPYFQRTYG